MARDWAQAQQREREFWSRIYVLRRRDIASYSPASPEALRAFADKILKRHGLRLEDLDGRTVADIGCGPYGILTGVAEEAGRFRRRPLLVGVDPLMRFFVSQIGILRSRENVRLYCARAEELPLADGCCDLVFCVNALDHMDQPESSIRELRRVLRPGGTCAVSLHTVTPLFTPVRGLLKHVDHNHPHHFSRGDIQRLLLRHFDRVEVSCVVSMLQDQPGFALRNVWRAPRKAEALARWLGTFVLRSLYFNCR